MNFEKKIPNSLQKIKVVRICALLLFLVTTFIFSFGLLTSCKGNMPKETSKESIINSFLPNLWVFIANVIAIVVLLLVFCFLTWKPTKRVLDERSKAIRDEIDAAKNANQLSQRLRAEAEKLKTEAYQRADTILYEAQFSAYHQKKEIVDSAKNYADEITANAQRELLKKEQVMREQVKNEMTKLVFRITEQLLARNVTTADNEKMINELINKINE